MQEFKIFTPFHTVIMSPSNLCMSFAEWLYRTLSPPLPVFNQPALGVFHKTLTEQGRERGFTKAPSGQYMGKQAGLRCTQVFSKRPASVSSAKLNSSSNRKYTLHRKDFGLKGIFSYFSTINTKHYLILTYGWLFPITLLIHLSTKTPNFDQTVHFCLSHQSTYVTSGL